MELIILLAVILSASIIESMISTVLKPRAQKPQEDKIDDALEDRFARIELDRDAPEFLPS